MDTSDNSGERSPGPQGSGNRGESPRKSGASGAGSSRGRATWVFLSVLLAIALLAALMIVAGLWAESEQLRAEREDLRRQVASLSDELDRAYSRETGEQEALGDVADQLLALHGRLTAMLDDEQVAGRGPAAESSEPPRGGSTGSRAEQQDGQQAEGKQWDRPSPEEDPDYWHDLALELAH